MPENEINPTDVLDAISTEDAPTENEPTEVEEAPAEEASEAAETTEVTEEQTEDKEEETPQVQVDEAVGTMLDEMLESIEEAPDDESLKTAVNSVEVELKAKKAELEQLKHDVSVINPLLGPDGKDLTLKIQMEDGRLTPLDFENALQIKEQIFTRQQAGQFAEADLIEKNYKQYQANKAKQQKYYDTFYEVDQAEWQVTGAKWESSIKAKYGVEVSSSQRQSVNDYLDKKIQQLAQVNAYDPNKKDALIQEALIQTGVVKQLKKALSAKTGEKKPQVSPDSKVKPKSVATSGGVNIDEILNKPYKSWTPEEVLALQKAART